MSEIKVGSIVTEQVLSKAFSRHFAPVLRAYPEPLPRKKRERQKYKVTAELPERDTYNALVQKHFTTTVATLVDDAFSEIESLRDEMREVFDNMPEGSSRETSDSGGSRLRAITSDFLKIKRNEEVKDERA